MRDYETLYTLYVRKGLSTAQIGRELGITHATVRYWLQKHNIPRRKQGTKGRRAHNWKGGIIKRRDGYVYIYMPDHPRAHKSGYMLEHIFIWTKYNGPIPTGWEIHHKNGNKHDNRIENLEALPPEKHAKVIPKLRKRIAYLEALLAENGIEYVAFEMD